MAYLLIPILHQLVHQIDYVIGVGGLAQNRIGPGEHGPILAASYDGANLGSSSWFVAKDDGFEREDRFACFGHGFDLCLETL
jgi:hypothetical protein